MEQRNKRLTEVSSKKVQPEHLYFLDYTYSLIFLHAFAAHEGKAEVLAFE